MRVLALGATGFIGVPVVRLLVERGHEVAVFHRGRTSADLPKPVQHIHGSRDALADVRSDFVRFAPDVVLDLIPYTERHALELVENIRSIAGRVVALSSADVYRNYDGLRGKSTATPDPVPLAEDAPLRTELYPYRDADLAFEHRHDYEKILVECVVLNQPDVTGTVLRLPAVYGPGDRQHRIRPYLRRMEDKRPAIMLDEGQVGWRWSRGYVDNVAAAIARAVSDTRSAGRIYNVSEEPVLTEYDWVQRIGSVAGWEGDILSVPAEYVPGGLRFPFDWRYHLATDSRRIRDELGYAEPVSAREALASTIAWERSQLRDEERPDYRAEDELLASIGTNSKP